MYEKRRYSILWVYKGGHEALPGWEDGWTKAEALEKAWTFARSVNVVPTDVQIYCELGVVDTQLTHKEAEAMGRIASGKGIR